MIKYLGSKRLLLPTILEAVRGLDQREGTPPLRSVLDLFSGTSRVGHALKRAGYQVIANDHNAYAHALATCYVEANREDVEDDARKLLQELSVLPGAPGYFTETFCEKARYLQPHNGERVDAIRDAIARKSLPPVLEAVVLVSLLEAADRVDSTTGVQMAYLKGWAKRSFKELELRLPDVLPRSAHGACRALRGEARDHADVEVDVAYLDPPYNQHSYLGNYHVWESLVTWDKPAVYGVANKRVDVRARQSAFNRRREHHAALSDVIRRVRARHLLVSFSDEGYVTPEQVRALLADRGEVRVIEIDYKRYVGAQIGIYSPQGVKTGSVGKLRNRELLFIA